MAMKIYRQVTRTYMKTFVQKNSPFMDFEIWPKFSLEPLFVPESIRSESIPQKLLHDSYSVDFRSRT